MSDSVEAVRTATPATLGGVTPILRVGELEASIAYYVDKLGFHLQWRADPLACVARDRTAVMLSEGDQGHSGTWLWISTTDADALYAELEARGAIVRFPPTNYPWGSRECQISDPDGHVLRFGADLKPGEPMGAWLDGAGRKWRPATDGGWRSAD
jgi:catechol 2,3-dioxygenase-like lactoylglutathione lyase family enzyme